MDRKDRAYRVLVSLAVSDQRQRFVQVVDRLAAGERKPTIYRLTQESPSAVRKAAEVWLDDDEIQEACERKQREDELNTPQGELREAMDKATGLRVLSERNRKLINGEGPEDCGFEYLENQRAGDGNFDEWVQADLSKKVAVACSAPIAFQFAHAAYRSYWKEKTNLRKPFRIQERTSDNYLRQMVRHLLESEKYLPSAELALYFHSKPRREQFEERLTEEAEKIEIGSGKWKRAMEALVHFRTSPHAFADDRLKAKIAHLFVEQRCFDRAEAMAEKITDPERQAQTYLEVINAHIEEGNARSAGSALEHSQYLVGLHHEAQLEVSRFLIGFFQNAGLHGEAERMAGSVKGAKNLDEWKSLIQKHDEIRDLFSELDQFADEERVKPVSQESPISSILDEAHIEASIPSMDSARQRFKEPRQSVMAVRQNILNLAYAHFGEGSFEEGDAILGLLKDE